jgi:hypothetical protein
MMNMVPGLAGGLASTGASAASELARKRKNTIIALSVVALLVWIGAAAGLYFEYQQYKQKKWTLIKWFIPAVVGTWAVAGGISFGLFMIFQRSNQKAALSMGLGAMGVKI